MTNPYKNTMNPEAFYTWEETNKMTKQEEIREEIANIVRYAEDNFILISDKDRQLLYDVADKLLSYLHSQGVVIKVDRELPTTPFLPSIRQLEAMQRTQRDMLKAGYVAVEPLIKEVR